MRSLISIAVVASSALAVLSVPAEAGACRTRVAGIGVGTGIFGGGSRKARLTAIGNWEAAAMASFGTKFGALLNAQDVRWDCHSGLLQAKCVVTAEPCRI